MEAGFTTGGFEHVGKPDAFNTETEALHDLHVPDQQANDFHQLLNTDYSSSDPDLALQVDQLKQQLTSIQSTTNDKVATLQEIKGDDTLSLQDAKKALIGEYDNLKPTPGNLPGPAENVSDDVHEKLKQAHEAYSTKHKELESLMQDPNFGTDTGKMIKAQRMIGELQVMTTLFAQMGKKTSEITSTLFRNQ